MFVVRPLPHAAWFPTRRAVAKSGQMLLKTLALGNRSPPKQVPPCCQRVSPLGGAIFDLARSCGMRSEENMVFSTLSSYFLLMQRRVYV